MFVVQDYLHLLLAFEFRTSVRQVRMVFGYMCCRIYKQHGKIGLQLKAA